MRFYFRLLLLLPLLFVVGCAAGDDDDDNGQDNQTDDDDDASPADDDAGDDTPDDDTPDGEPLYAAAGTAVLTPTAANHPETIYLGGIIPSRIGTGVHDDLTATALALKQGDRTLMLVSLDFLGFSRSRTREIQERVTAEGLAKENILIASTHTHEGPDTLGVFGPNVFTSGVSPEYMAFVQDAIVALIDDTWEKLEPVTMTAATTTIDDPLSNYPTLMADFREPQLTVGWLSAAQFIGLDGIPVATLVNWHAHPEVMIESTLVSADFPGYLRQRVRDRVGGECVYISGALGGLATPTGVDVPARDENGDPVLDEDQQPVYLQEGTWDKARSLGFVLADLALGALETASPVESPVLEVQVEQLLSPVKSLLFIMGFLIHLLEFDAQDVVKDQPDICGWFGCVDDRLGMVRLGPLALITSPGETFPETLIGREASDYDYGDPWGVFHFPAMTGILSSMNAEVPMLMSVCGNEVAYLIPESDYHPYGHPDHYEEDLCFGRQNEEIYRQAAIKLLESK
ncbi:MAG: hypothetical protein GX444_06975 [Myxococcales bacterium]|nr:hypothetical protein [Myxococcales bacterium]